MNSKVKEILDSCGANSDWVKEGNEAIDQETADAASDLIDAYLDANPTFRIEDVFAYPIGAIGVEFFDEKSMVETAFSVSGSSVTEVN